MEVTSTTTMLKPVMHSAPPHALAGDKVPLTVFDRAAIDTFVPMVFAYRAPAPSNEALKEGLLRALAPYPHTAGRLAVDDQGRRSLHLNNEGVFVIEAIVPADLADVLATGPGMAITNAGDMYPAVPKEAVGAAVLQIKLSRYRCGGLVIGIIFHHHVADGYSGSTFYTTWARAVREGKGFTVPPPFLDRTATAVPRGTPAPVFDHRSIEFKGSRSSSSRSYAVDKIKNLAVHFTADFIAELRARVGGGDRRCSTFQCVLAHVWKKITAARRLDPEEFTQVRVAVDCRTRASPPVPNFFGNMVLWAFARLQVRAVLSWSYGGVVGAIRDATARVDEEYIQSFVDFGGVADANGDELVATAAAGTTMLCPDLEVDSWLGFRFHQLDFGTGPPSAFLPDLSVEGLMVFVPSSRTVEGGVDLFIAVAEEHATAFEQTCYSLDPLAARM